MTPAIVVVSLLVGATTTRGQSPSHGPLTYEEGAPLHRVAYTAMTEGAAVTPAGGFVADLWLGYSNIFEQDSTATHVVFMDLERLVTSLALRWGAADGLELGARIQLETTGPGVLDGPIEGWHELWGFGQANRDRFPRDGYRQHLRDGDGSVYVDIPRRDLALEDVRLFAKQELWPGSVRPIRASIRAEVRLPGGSNPSAEERPDASLALLTRAGSGPWYLHGMLGASTLRGSPELDPILQPASAFLTLALERSFGPFSAVAQYQVQSAALKSFEHRELDRAASNLILGLSGAIGTAWSWDASFQEDLPSDTPAIDFTLGLRVSRRW